ncbi:MAG: hypothetical protein JSS37_02650 [Proteobacteria bacterium]|nr:hypothetical protein [Pseudomonadota bacterium]
MTEQECEEFNKFMEDWLMKRRADPIERLKREVRLLKKDEREHNDPRLEDFIMQVRATPDAEIDKETLKYVAQIIETLLNGKNHFPKKRGNQPKRDSMWRCYWLTNFTGPETPHLPLHCNEGGVYYIVGDLLKKSPNTVESHARNARELMDTPEGRREFEHWQYRCRNGGRFVPVLPHDHPSTIAELERREKAGIPTRFTRKAKKLISGQIPRNNQIPRNELDK